MKNASSKRLQKLIDKQTDRDRQSILQGQVKKYIIRQLPEQKYYFSFRMPTPKCITCILMEGKNTIVNKLPYITPNLFSQVPPPPNSHQAYVPTITQDEDELPPPMIMKYLQRKYPRGYNIITSSDKSNFTTISSRHLTASIVLIPR